MSDPITPPPYGGPGGPGGPGYGPAGPSGPGGPGYGPGGPGGPGYGPGGPAGPGYGYGYGYGPQQRSKLAAGLLGIFLGVLGVHRFYLGYTTLGVVMLVTSLVGGLVTCGLATAAVSIWGLIEGILYLVGSSGFTHDAKGVPLRD